MASPRRHVDNMDRINNNHTQVKLRARLTPIYFLVHTLITINYIDLWTYLDSSVPNKSGVKHFLHAHASRHKRMLLSLSDLSNLIL